MASTPKSDGCQEGSAEDSTKTLEHPHVSISRMSPSESQSGIHTVGIRVVQVQGFGAGWMRALPAHY